MHAGTPKSQPSRSVDIIIIGGGLAGLAAADRLTQGGAHALVLEASDRIGGRTYGWHWDAADREIDLGGTWLLPSFATAFRLLTELTLAHYDSPTATRILTHFSEGIRERSSIDPELARSLPAVAARLSHARRLAPLTAAKALNDAEVAPPAHDWHAATQRYLAGAPLSEIDAAHLLLDIEDLENPDHYSTQISGTTRSLAEALAQRSEAELLTQCPVASVERQGDEWFVRTADNQTFTAAEVVMAVPRNVLGNITLSPEPQGALAELIREPHVGASRKDWFILDGVTEHFRVFASEGPFGYFRSEAVLADGGMLAVGLAPQAEGAPTQDEFASQIRHYLPGATIRAHVSHDWVSEQWARGTWYVPRPGDPERNEALESGHASLQIVGGDFSIDFPGTIEGALRTGIASAEHILARR